jgi:hypothetical protein
MPDLEYCPRCGQRLDPLVAYSGEANATLLAECPTHGEIEIDYEQTQA